MLAVIVTASGCAPLAVQESRPAKSSLGCMQAAIEKLPLTGLPDSRAHCEASGLIARHCSVSEAVIASVGKEVRDLFTGGDAEWRDLMSDRRGIRCARHSNGDAELVACCASSE